MVKSWLTFCEGSYNTRSCSSLQWRASGADNVLSDEGCIIANERNNVTQALTTDDDCLCEMCKNNELLLEAIKLHFRKAKQQGLADDLPSERLSLVKLGVCSSKNYPCSGQCEKCPGKTMQSPVCVSS